MPSLESHLKNLNFHNQLSTVNNLLALAHPKVTFWENRLISVDGFTGEVPIDYIASRILHYTGFIEGRPFTMFSSPLDHIILSPSESHAGMEIVEKIHNFYLFTDQEIQQSSFLTKCLKVFIKVIFFIPKHIFFDSYDEYKSTRTSFEDDYNKSRFQLAFIPTQAQLEDEQRRRAEYLNRLVIREPFF